MRYLGEVLEVFSANSSESLLPRPIVKSLEAIEGYGIKNDKFAGKDEDKSVMIVGKNAYELARNHNIQLQNGTFGENILLDFSPHDLPKNITLAIGDVKLTIKENCTVCDHLVQFDAKLPRIVKGSRGVYCKIEQSGTIQKGMKVYLKD